MIPDVYNGGSFDADVQILGSMPELGQIAHLLEAFLDELCGDETSVWKLCRRKEEHHSPFFNCRAIEWMQTQRFNMYRLRPLTRRLKGVRILYAFDHQSDKFYLLAATAKLPEGERLDPPHRYYYDYEQSHFITQRVLDEYAALGLPRIGDA